MTIVQQRIIVATVLLTIVVSISAALGYIVFTSNQAPEQPISNGDQDTVDLSGDLVDAGGIDQQDNTLQPDEEINADEDLADPRPVEEPITQGDDDDDDASTGAATNNDNSSAGDNSDSDSDGNIAELSGSATCGNNILDDGEACDPPGEIIEDGRECRQDCSLDPAITFGEVVLSKTVTKTCTGGLLTINNQVFIENLNTTNPLRVNDFTEELSTSVSNFNSSTVNITSDNDRLTYSGLEIAPEQTFVLNYSYTVSAAQALATDNILRTDLIIIYDNSRFGDSPGEEITYVDRQVLSCVQLPQTDFEDSTMWIVATSLIIFALLAWRLGIATPQVEKFLNILEDKYNRTINPSYAFETDLTKQDKEK